MYGKSKIPSKSKGNSKSKVHLKLHVRVQENWTERPENYALFGLETNV